MVKLKKSRVAVTAIILLLVFLFFWGAFRVKVTPSSYNMSLAELQNVISREFYQSVSDEDLYTGAARGMVSALGDKYAEYFTAEEYAASQQVKSGKYTGIGITFSLDEDGQFIVVKKISDGPADRAGIELGDLLVSVDGKSLLGLSMTEVSDLIKAKGENEFTLGLLRDGTAVSVSLRCEDVVTERVRYVLLEDNIAYVQITGFYGTCAEEFSEALKNFRADGATALVLDLRGNLGGNLDLMLSIADEVMEEGVVLSIRSRNGGESIYRSHSGSLGVPIAVLVNGSSASASEALTGALQDSGVGFAVGTQTYGKGIVQTTFHLTESDGWVKMTTGSYYTPNGRSIHEVGITPDIVVEMPEDLEGIQPEYLTAEQDIQLQAAIEALKERRKDADAFSN